MLAFGGMGIVVALLLAPLAGASPGVVHAAGSGAHRASQVAEVAAEPVTLISLTDTSGNASEWLLCALAKHPHIQAAVYDELSRVFPDGRRHYWMRR